MNLTHKETVKKFITGTLPQHIACKNTQTMRIKLHTVLVGTRKNINITRRPPRFHEYDKKYKLIKALV